MTLQYSTAVRNAKLDAVEVTIGASPLLRVYTGAPPAAPSDSATGTLLAECALPADFMAAASGGSKAKNGTWEDTSANATGTAGYWRIYDNAGTTCHAQGTITGTGGGGDMEVNNTSFTAGQAFTVSTFTLTDGNA